MYMLIQVMIRIIAKCCTQSRPKYFWGAGSPTSMSFLMLLTVPHHNNLLRSFLISIQMVRVWLRNQLNIWLLINRMRTQGHTYNEMVKELCFIFDSKSTVFYSFSFFFLGFCWESVLVPSFLTLNPLIS